MSLVPDLLTIEEAARVLRIGRTKAYAMGQEWRVTDGRSGIKVREFGGQLRVPRVWIEEQLGSPLRSIPQRPRRGKAEPQPEELELRQPPATPATKPTTPPRTRRRKNASASNNASQLALPFD